MFRVSENVLDLPGCWLVASPSHSAESMLTSFRCSGVLRPLLSSRACCRVVESHYQLSIYVLLFIILWGVLNETMKHDEQTASLTCSRAAARASRAWRCFSTWTRSLCNSINTLHTIQFGKGDTRTWHHYIMDHIWTTCMQYAIWIEYQCAWYEKVTLPSSCSTLTGSAHCIWPSHFCKLLRGRAETRYLYIVSSTFT